jgi:hypothetical protein
MSSSVALALAMIKWWLFTNVMQVGLPKWANYKDEDVCRVRSYLGSDDIHQFGALPDIKYMPNIRPP